MWAHAALLAARNIPIFAIVAAPPVAALPADLAGPLPVARSGRLGANGRAQSSTAWPRETSGHRPHRAAGTWSASLAHAAGGCAAVRAASAEAVPAGVRSEVAIPAGAIATLRRDPSARIFTLRRVGRLSDLPALSRRPRSSWTAAAISTAPISRRNTSTCCNVKYDWEKTLGEFRRRHDFIAPQRAACRRAEGIQPLARRL